MVGLIMDTTDASNTTVGSKSAAQWPSFRVTPPDPVLGKKEMSPEQTLVEFISTSAAFHGVKKQQLRTLEWDLLKVFPNNIMPANAAAWFMAKRKFYMNQPLDQQLLPFLLKKYPDKFQIRRNQVTFLDKYSKETAKRKLQYLVQYGINAYFAHKADEYGVYFFDPFYYENTEPFHESLRQTTNKPNAHRSKLVPEYFKTYREQFKFEQHSPYLVSISKQPGVKVVTNTTGVIVSMVNNQYGFIKFGSSEKALFCAKSLFRDGWQYTGDPLRLPAMQFDGYQIPGGGREGEQQYSWYAVLVWCGRKPSPKYCSTTDDLNSTPVFRAPGGEVREEAVYQGKKLRQPSSSMMIGQVIEIRKNGAIVSVRDDSEEKVYVPGWRHENQARKGVWLTTITGENVGLRDLVAYYVDTNNTKPGFHAVGKNVMVLKEYEEVESTKRSTRVREMSEGSDDPRRRVRDGESSEEETEQEDSELEVEDSELEWLERDIEAIIETEPPEAKTLKLLVEVKSALVGARELRRTTPTRGKTTPSPGPDSGVASKETTPRPDPRELYHPLPDQEQSFWRLKAALASLEDYNSEDDEDYRPGQDIHQEQPPVELDVDHDTSFVSDSSCFLAHSTIKERRRRMSSMGSSGVPSDGEESKYLPYWVKAVQQPMVWCPHTNKFLVLDIGYREERDPDYSLPFTDDEDDVEEDEEEDLEMLLKEAEEPLSQDVVDGKHRFAGAGTVRRPPKIVITPVKDDKKEGEDDNLAEQEIVNVNESSEGKSDGEDIDDGKGGDGDKSGENGTAMMGEAKLWVRELALKEQDEEYDSDTDPEWVPPPIIYDADLDYGEWEEEEEDTISEEELRLLEEDMKKSLEPGPSLPPQLCGCQEEAAKETTELDHADKRSAVNLSPESGLTPVMKKLKLSFSDQPLEEPQVEVAMEAKQSDPENNEKTGDADNLTKNEEATKDDTAPKPKRAISKKSKGKASEKVTSPKEKSPLKTSEKETKSPEKEKIQEKVVKSKVEKIEKATKSDKNGEKPGKGLDKNLKAKNGKVGNKIESGGEDDGKGKVKSVENAGKVEGAGKGKDSQKVTKVPGKVEDEATEKTEGAKKVEGESTTKIEGGKEKIGNGEKAAESAGKEEK